MNFLPGWGKMLGASIVPPPQSFSFDGSNDVLTHTWGSTGTLAERRTVTISFWSRSPTVGSNSSDFDIVGIFITDDESELDFWTVRNGDTAAADRMPQMNTEGGAETAEGGDAVLANVWHHWVIRFDSTQGTTDNRLRFYQDGNLLSDTGAGVTSDYPLLAFVSGNLVEIGGITGLSVFREGDVAFYEVVSGASLDPTSFAYDDGGTWTALHPNLSLNYGNFGFRLDGRNGDFTDASGNGFDFTQSGGVTLDAVNLPPYGAG